MKPVVSALNAWSCLVISIFAMVILTVIGTLFKKNHHSFMGSINDPKDGAAVAGSIFTAVLIYAAFAAFCGVQAFLHIRASRRGAITLS